MHIFFGDIGINKIVGIEKFDILISLKPATHEAFSSIFEMGALVCNLESFRVRNDVTAGCLSG